MIDRDAATVTWTHADAWVLAALGGTSATEPSSLSGLIGRADAMEHAVLEPAEFAQSAGRLITAGLIATDSEQHYWLTEAGQRLHADRTQRGSWSRSIPVGLRTLGPPTGDPLRLPAGAFRRAVDSYLSEAGRAS